MVVHGSTSNSNPLQELHDSHFQDNNLRSSLIGMGFQPPLVDQVIQDKGEDDVELLVDTLVSISGPQKSNSDSLDSLFDDDDGVSSPPEISQFIDPKGEPDIPNGVNDGKRASLLMMKFSLDEINFAIKRLGEDTPIDGLVDFIVVAQMEKKKLDDNATEEKDAVLNDSAITNEVLFGTMDKTLHLLEMGFSEKQVSWAIEKFGSEVPISELADSIFTGRTPDSCKRKKKQENFATTNGDNSTSGCGSFSSGTEGFRRNSFSNPVKVDTEDFHTRTVSQPMAANAGIRQPKQEILEDGFEDGPHFRNLEREEIRKGKRPKQEDEDDFGSIEEKFDPRSDQYGTPSPVKNLPRKSLTGSDARPPYFLYGIVGNTTSESWLKISKNLYNVDPEFANTEFFSALRRTEGYIHNLPTENRFLIVPNSPMTIEEAMPQTKKHWPSWDNRKQLVCISSDVNGVSQLCNRLRKTLDDAHGLVSAEQQRNILHHCRSSNLVWIGRNRLGPIDPGSLESILGYPVNHTETCISLEERLESLRHSFQTDTLGYHLSVLKHIYPSGVSVLSVFSGIGGAEVALHRLGIRLKAVVSVESCESKRKILKKWWERSGQTGDLTQIENIQKLTMSKLWGFMEKYGGFELVICENPSSITQNGEDYSVFSEFVRVLKCVRRGTGNKR